MAYKNYVKAIPLKSIDSATFTGSYQNINAGLINPCFLLRIVNNSNKDVTVSYDGSTDHDFVPAGKELNILAGSVSQPNNFNTIFAQGMPVWVKGAAGAGLVYVAGYFMPSAN